jgi:ABC-type sulfate/molybdate transport systems ATPase subunit
MLADEIVVFENGRVLQAGPTDAVFRRPNNETVARLLGTDQAAEGIAVGPDGIAISPRVVLKVAGPALKPGACVGWAVSAARVRLDESGRYDGVVEAVTHVASGHLIAIRFGDARINATAGYIDPPCGSACRFDIDADAVRIWPLN